MVHLIKDPKFACCEPVNPWSCFNFVFHAASELERSILHTRAQGELEEFLGHYVMKLVTFCQRDSVIHEMICNEKEHVTWPVLYEEPRERRVSHILCQRVIDYNPNNLFNSHCKLSIKYVTKVKTVPAEGGPLLLLRVPRWIILIRRSE